MRRVNGLHHITAIAGPAQENLDFYAGVLGMRLVKRSVNQDDPGTYHLFYADAEGHPGTDLTFFPWAQLAPPRLGHGLAMEVALEVPAGSLAFWGARLEHYGARIEADREALRRRACCRWSIRTACGWRWSSRRPASASFTPWERSSVPAERQVRGLYGAQLWERDLSADRDVPDHRARLRAPRQRERLDALRLRGRRRASSTFAKPATPGAARGASAACTISPGAWTTRRTSSRCGRRSKAAGPARRR